MSAHMDGMDVALRSSNWEDMTMKKLIATEFDYILRDEFGTTRKAHGSYLGRKVATFRTIRHFLRGNMRRYVPLDSIVSITMGGNYVSQWIAK